MAVSIGLKCPSFDEFVFSAPLSMSIAEMKAKVASEHPLKPFSDAQRIIFCGRILNDLEKLQTILNPEIFDLSQKQSFHLFIRAPHNPLPILNPNGVSATADSRPQPLIQSPQALNQGGVFQNPNYPPNANAYMNQMNAYNAQIAQFQQQRLMEMQQRMQQMPQLQQQGHQIRGHVRVISIDFGLIFKLALGVYLLSHGGGEERLAFLIATAIAFYFFTVGFGRRFAVDQNGQPIQGDNNANGAIPANANDAQRNVPYYLRREGGILNNLAAFFVPLILSLHPYWELPEVHEVTENGAAAARPEAVEEERDRRED